MSHTITDCPDITILNGQTDSNIVPADLVYDDAELILLLGPVGAPATIIQVTDDPMAASPTFYNLQDSSLADLAGPAATEAIVVQIPAKGFRLHAATPVGADVVFKMQKRGLGDAYNA